MDIAGYSIEDQVVSEIGRFAILWNEFEKKHRDYGRGKRFRERNYRETAQEENLKLADSLSFDRSSYKFIRNYLLSQMRLHRYDESETKHFVESYLFTDNARINVTIQSSKPTALGT